MCRVRRLISSWRRVRENLGRAGAHGRPRNVSLQRIQAARIRERRKTTAVFARRLVRRDDYRADVRDREWSRPRNALCDRSWGAGRRTSAATRHRARVRGIVTWLAETDAARAARLRLECRHSRRRSGGCPRAGGHATDEALGQTATQTLQRKMMTGIMTTMTRSQTCLSSIDI